MLHKKFFLICNLDIIKIKKYSLGKKAVRRKKIQDLEITLQRIQLIGNLFPGCIKIYKELSNLNNKKTDTTINNMQKILTET